MLINMDLNELAAEITQKIRDEMGKVRVVDFGEVQTITKLDNGGWTAQVLLPGAINLTNPLNCLQNYIPKIGDWVMILYPPKAEPVLVDCTPMRENQIVTPDDRYASDGNHHHDDLYYRQSESDTKYATSEHDHDGRYYTKTQSDDRYSLKNEFPEHFHDDRYAKIQQPDWTAPELWNGWISQAGSTHNDPGFRLNTIGEVHLRGRISGGQLETAAFQLPEGHRPQKIETRLGVSDFLPCAIDIHPNGIVFVITGSPESWISLDGISFSVN